MNQTNSGCRKYIAIVLAYYTERDISPKTIITESISKIIHQNIVVKMRY